MEWANYQIATKLDTKKEKNIVATLLAIIGKKVLEIYHYLPLTKEERTNPEEIIDKLKTYFKL